MSVLETLQAHEKTGPGREQAAYRYRRHPNWRRLFFRSLMQHGSVPRAAHEVGVHPKTVHRLKRTDARFKRKYDEAMLQANLTLKSELESALRERATVGYTRTVLDKFGEAVEVRDKPSDKAAELLLKAKFPKQYDRRSTASSGVTVNIVTQEARIALLRDPEARKRACDLAALIAAPRALQGPSSEGPVCDPHSGPESSGA